MGSTCRQMCQDGGSEIPHKQFTTSKKHKFESNKISIQISIDQNKENTRHTQSLVNGSPMIEEEAENTINDYNRIEANGIEIPELTGDIDRVESILITEHKEKPIPSIPNDVLSVGSKKAILKRETKYSKFRNQSENANQ